MSASPKHIYDDGRIHTQFVLLCCVANSNNRVFLLLREDEIISNPNTINRV